MKVLVTGGNGFIGSVVVKTLLANCHEVRCTLRKTSNTDRLKGLAYESVEADVRDLPSMKAAIVGCEAIIHLASPSSWNDINSPVLEAVVQTGTTNVLEAAKEVKAKVVFCSSAVAINASEEPTIFDESAEFTVRDPQLRYANSKHAAEELCKKAVAGGQFVVIVNPGEVYGPNDTGFITAGNLVDFAKSSPVLVSNGGTGIVHIDDVALGIVRALEKGRSGERYALAGQNMSIRELAETTLKILGLKRSVVSVPNSVLKALTKTAVTLHLPLPYNANVVPYATRYWFVSNKKATEELGVKFRSGEEALTPTLAWLKEAGHIKLNPN